VDALAEGIDRRMHQAQERGDYQAAPLETEYSILLKMILTGKGSCS
jgi:hypothetical protein